MRVKYLLFGKIPEVITRAEPEPQNGRISGIHAHSLQENLMQTNEWYDGKCIRYSGGVPFGGLNPPDISNPKRETPNPKNGSQKFISSTLSDEEKFAKFNGKLLFKSEQKRKLLLRDGSLELTLDVSNPLVTSDTEEVMRSGR